MFREKSSILSGLLTGPDEPGQVASEGSEGSDGHQTVMISPEPAGQTGTNLSNIVKAKKSAGVGSGLLPCGLQCKRIRQVRLVTVTVCQCASVTVGTVSCNNVN